MQAPRVLIGVPPRLRIWWVESVGAYLRPRDHHLLESLLDSRLDLGNNLGDRDVGLPASGEGDDAEGTELIAPILNFDESPGTGGIAIAGLRSASIERRKRPVFIHQSQALHSLQDPGLVLVSHHHRDPFHFGEVLRGPLSVTSRCYHSGLGIFEVRRPEPTTGLAVGDVGDCASVQDVDVCFFIRIDQTVTCLEKPPAYRVRLRPVKFTAVGSYRDPRPSWSIFQSIHRWDLDCSPAVAIARSPPNWL